MDPGRCWRRRKRSGTALAPAKAARLPSNPWTIRASNPLNPDAPQPSTRSTGRIQSARTDVGRASFLAPLGLRRLPGRCQFLFIEIAEGFGRDVECHDAILGRHKVNVVQRHDAWQLCNVAGEGAEIVIGAG